MAAVLGGTQSLHCNGRDEALGLPTEAAAQIALRTQQIIAAETGVTNTVDPVGGAWAIERLTDQMEEEVVALLDRIDQQGGGLAAIETGFVQREIQDSAYRAQRAIDTDEVTVVGVNDFTSEEPARIEVLRIDPALETQQVERVRALRLSRDSAQCIAALEQVSQVARGQANLVPAIIAAVEAYATVGEIADALREVLGEYRDDC